MCLVVSVEGEKRFAIVERQLRIYQAGGAVKLTGRKWLQRKCIKVSGKAKLDESQDRSLGVRLTHVSDRKIMVAQSFGKSAAGDFRVAYWRERSRTPRHIGSLIAIAKSQDG